MPRRKGRKRSNSAVRGSRVAGSGSGFGAHRGAFRRNDPITGGCLLQEGKEVRRILDLRTAARICLAGIKAACCANHTDPNREPATPRTADLRDQKANLTPICPVRGMAPGRSDRTTRKSVVRRSDAGWPSTIVIGFSNAGRSLTLKISPNRSSARSPSLNSR